MYQTDRKTVALRILVVLVLVVLGTWAGSCVAAKRVWSQYDDLKLQFDSTATRLKSVQSDFAGLQSASTARQKDNDSLQTKLKSLQGDLTQAQSAASSQQKNSEALRAQLADIQAAVAAQKKDNETSAAQLTQVRTELSQAQSKITALQQENASLRNRSAGPTEADLAEMKSRNNALQESIASLRAQLSSAQSQSSQGTLQQDIATLRAQLDAWYNWLRNSPAPPATLPGSVPAVPASGLNLVLSPTAGPVGATISVSGTGFMANVSGTVLLDINGSGFVDSGEPTAYLTTTPGGTFSTTLTVSSDVPPGNYAILARFPTSNTAPSSAIFTVTVGSVVTSGQSLTLSPITGPAGTVISVSGAGFTPNVTGNVFLDINGNGNIDSGEPSQYLSTTPSGTFSTTLTVPSFPAIPAGAYNVRARLPAATATPSAAAFTVTGAAGVNLTLSPAYGPTGTTMSVSGSGFMPSVNGNVFLDINRNGFVDGGEPIQYVTTTSTGTFSTTLTVPSGVAHGAYTLTARFPTSASTPSTATFNVTP